MLVARILREVDAELERLQTARNTIAALIASAPPPRTEWVVAFVPSQASTQPAAVPPQEIVPLATDDPVPAPASVVAEAPRRRGRPKGSVNRRTARPVRREPTALAPARTAGPVFVSAAELERGRTRALPPAEPEHVEAAVAAGTLESLIREMADRRMGAAA